MIRLLLVYENSVLLRLLEWVLHDTSEVQVVARARTPSEACDLMRETSPDVVVIDHDGELLDHLLDADAKANVLIFAEMHDAAARQQAIKMGAHGVVQADACPAVLLRAIKAVHAGELWISRSDATALIDELRSRVRRPVQFDLLTHRQREIVDVLCTSPGYRGARLADSVSLTQNVLRSELSSIYRTLGVSSHRGLLRLLEDVPPQAGL